MTNQMIGEHFDEYIRILQAKLLTDTNITEVEKECLKHFIKISLKLRQRLIVCLEFFHHTHQYSTSGGLFSRGSTRMLGWV